MYTEEELETKYIIHNPHDKALFKSLEILEVAKDALQAYLPKALLNMANLEGIKHYRTKFVTPEFQQFDADIIYEVPMENNHKGLFLFHIEHQSRVEKHMPLRMWQYMLLLLMEYGKNHPKEPLPLIYPLVIYTGEVPYKESMDIFDLFGEHGYLARNYLLKPIQLVDVCELADEDIKKHHYFGLAEFAFKYKFTQDFEKFLQEFFPWVHEVEFQIHQDYIIMLLKYLVDINPTANYEIFVEQTKNYLSKELGEKAMTIAEQLERRGMEKGIQQGIEQGLAKKSKEIARNLLLLGELSIESISVVTQLSIEEIQVLAATIKH